MLRWFYKLVSLGWWLRDHVRRRFTTAGLVVGACLFVALIAGLDTENSVQYQGFAILLGLVTASLIFLPFFRLRFSATRVLPRFATVGHPVQYTLIVRNLSRHVQRGLTLLEGVTFQRPSFEDWEASQRDLESRSFRLERMEPQVPLRLANAREALVPEIPSQHSASLRVELTPLRRGILRLDLLSLGRPDPLGLVRSFSSIRVPQSLLVLPRRYLLPPIALPGATRYQQGGVAMASHVGQSEDFVSLREYRHGDPVRHIHWRSWAKLGKPVVKEFEDEFFVRHALVLDTFVGPHQAALFEEAVSVAASFACAIQTQESLLDLLFVGGQSYCFTAGRGLAREDQMLEILASVRPCRDRTFSELEQLVYNHVALVSGCVCVLLAWDEPRQKFVRELRAMGTEVLVLVIQPSGGAIALAPGAMRDAPARFHVLEMGDIEQGLSRLGTEYPPGGSADGKAAPPVGGAAMKPPARNGNAHPTASPATTAGGRA